MGTSTTTGHDGFGPAALLLPIVALSSARLSSPSDAYEEALGVASVESLEQMEELSGPVRVFALSPKRGSERADA